MFQAGKPADYQVGEVSTRFTEERFKCPCHGSNFLMDGTNVAGPAPVPLYRAALALGDFRERFYCDRVSMPNAPQDMENSHAVGRSYCGHARLDAGIP
jgi:hypothetical protein